MQKRYLILTAVVVVLAAAAFASAQSNLPVLARADEVVSEQTGQTTFTGNVRFTINGVRVQADRAVVQEDGEVALEGNVRLTLPKGALVSTVKTMPALTPLPPRN